MILTTISVSLLVLATCIQVQKKLKGIYGKTSELLQRHHANEWTRINAKRKAVCEGSDALERLRQAVGALGREHVENITDPDAWHGAQTVLPVVLQRDIPLLPRADHHQVRISLFGVSQFGAPLVRKKHGRHRGTPDIHPDASFVRRQLPDCANPLCLAWSNCKAGVRRNLCPWYKTLCDSTPCLVYLTKKEMRDRRAQYLEIMNRHPTMGENCAAMSASTSFRQLVFNVT